MAARADLGEDLKAALQLELVELAERTFVGEGHILDMPTFASGDSATGSQGQGRSGDECDVAEHFRFPLTRPDGLWSRSGH